MTEKELRKLNRAELLELLLQERKENKKLRNQLQDLQKQLDNRQIMIDNAGSIAQAALQLNGVFEAAEKAAIQYLENIKRIGQERMK